MARTYYREEAGLPRPPGLATPYLDRFNEGIVESVGDRSPAMRQNHSYGAGDVLADLADHARFAEALFGGELISPEALHLMSTPEGPGFNYGYGLGMIITRIASVDESRFGKAHGHGGRGPFGIMEMNYFPKAKVTIGFASNYGYPGSERQPVNIFDGLDARFGDAVFNKRDQAAGAANLERPASRLSGRTPIRRPAVHKDAR
jgi:CubicO group peptidase (beta-lactamase class C family)